MSFVFSLTRLSVVKVLILNTNTVTLLFLFFSIRDEQRSVCGNIRDGCYSLVVDKLVRRRLLIYISLEVVLSYEFFKRIKLAGKRMGYVGFSLLALAGKAVEPSAKVMRENYQSVYSDHQP